MKKHVLFLFAIFISFSFAANAQTIVGTIIGSDDGSPIPGVRVIEKGTTKGTITTIDGKFSLNVTNPKAVLLFSSVGYTSQEISLNGQTKIDLVLQIESKSLDEVVVIGYGATAKKNVASAMSVVKSEALRGMTTTDTRQALQGKIAGVRVTNNSGDPGSGASVVIRGIGSFSNSEPLYVVDGIQGGDINSVATQDIESMTILKDAATTAIYGSAAANGVVIVTTKSGKKGALKVSYEGSAGVARIGKRLDLLNASQYVDLVADIQASGGLPMTPKLLTPAVRQDKTDWQNVVMQDALVTDHSLQLSGGGDNYNFLFSTGYQNHGSTIIDQNFQRLTFGVKLAENLWSNKIKLTQSLRIKNDKFKNSIANLNDALRMPPYVSIYDPTNLGGYGRVDKPTDLQDANNPFNAVYNSPYGRSGLSVELDLGAQVDIVKGLSFKTQARLWSGSGHNTTFNFPSNGGNFSRSSSDMDENFNVYSGMMLENFFNYSTEIGKHDLSFTAGNSFQPSVISNSINAKGSNFTSDAIQNIALADKNSIAGAYVNSGSARLSYFGRAGYTFNEKYVFNLSLRRDATSKFAEDKRWGTFYGVGAAWELSKEEFLKPITAISNLKLRTSYGKTGNDNIPVFLTSSTVWKGDANNVVYSFGDNLTYANGAIVNSVPNNLLKWEETSQFDLGLDLGLFNNKLTFVLDYYNRTNKNLLIETTLPLTTGLGRPGSAGTQWINAASMKNSGFEFTATYANNSADFKWDVSANVTYNVNEVTALGTIGDIPITKGEFVSGVGNSTRTDIGHPLASYYGYKFDHVAVNQAEITALNAATVVKTGGTVTEFMKGLKPGDRIWKDVDGNGYVDTKDRDYIGNPSPKFQYGMTFNASYKRFDFQVLLQGIAGIDVVNGSRYWWEGMSKPFNTTSAVLDRWKKEGDIASYPRAGQNPGNNLVFSDWYVEKGDYLRLKNITVGYTLPKSVTKIGSLRMYVAVQNLLTLTNYSGYDPEISSYESNNSQTQIFTQGIDLYQRPNPISSRFGIQLNF